MSEKKLSINTENILPIIKKWLYADKEVFLRELVANAQDAISKRKIAYTSDCQDKISITLDQEKKTLTITDTGIGMTCDEIETYIAQIAFSGAEEFAKHYESSKDTIIGHFGLGFYSSYMVASCVEIFSLSFKEDSKGAYWKCDGGVDYTLETCEKEQKGTTIVLHLLDDALEFLEKERIESLLNTYCKFFPVSIDINGEEFKTHEPLWLKNPQGLSREDYLSFYKVLYPYDEEPLFWVHLNIDYPYNVKGILYFPKIGKSYDFQKSHISLYSSRVFVSDNCKDLLPDYLTVLKGCIDSPDIPLNVSRSYLQMDKNVRSLANHISKKVSSVLSDGFQENRAHFEENFSHIETVIKLGILQDEKLFDRVEPFLLLKNTDGSYQTLSEAKGADESKKLYYTQDLHQSAGLLKAFKEKNIPVYLLNNPLDSAVLHLFESKASLSFSRLDGQLPSELMSDEEQDASSISSLFEGLQLKIKNFGSPQIAGMYVIQESMRRFKEYMQLSQKEGLDQMALPSELVLNTQSPLVKQFLKAPTQEMATWLKHFVALSQNLLKPQDLASFIETTPFVFESRSQEAELKALS